jgi:hypothetical protein
MFCPLQIGTCVYMIMEAYDFRAAVPAIVLGHVPAWYLVYRRISVPHAALQVAFLGCVAIAAQAGMAYRREMARRYGARRAGAVKKQA